MTAAHHQQEMQLALVQASHCGTLSVTNTVKTSWLLTWLVNIETKCLHQHAQEIHKHNQQKNYNRGHDFNTAMYTWIKQTLKRDITQSSNKLPWLKPGGLQGEAKHWNVSTFGQMLAHGTKVSMWDKCTTYSIHLFQISFEWFELLLPRNYCTQHLCAHMWQ